MSTMMLIQDKEKILACGAAVAPVTSWLYYGKGNLIKGISGVVMCS